MNEAPPDHPADEGDSQDPLGGISQEYLSITDRLVASVGASPDDMLAAGLEGLLEEALEARVAAGLPNRVDEYASDEDVMQGEFLKCRVGEYVDNDNSLTAAEQLDIMRDFWTHLGYELPKLDETQVSKLQAALEANPGMRILPAPLNVDQSQNVAHRRKMTEAARFITGSEVHAFGSVMTIEYGDKDSLSEEYGSLRYAMGDGKLVDRNDYIRALRESGEAIDDEDPGYIWAFSLLDPNPDATASISTIGAMRPAISPALTPEAVIALNILHATSGHMPRDEAYQLTNEFLVENQNPSDISAPEVSITVVWRSADRKLDMTTALICDVNVRYGDRDDEQGPDPHPQPILDNDKKYVVMKDYLARRAVSVAL